MKVVLFCGGQGLRLRDYSENTPKPMVPIGYRPIMWHLMKYYAHYGHREFILCLGYKADVIKDYFLRYNECVTNDFVLSNGGRDLKLLSKDTDDWTITFVDTGFASNIGQRLYAVREHLGDDEVFMANYADNLTDLELPKLIHHFRAQDKIGCFLSAKPSQSFHLVQSGDDSVVTDIVPAATSDVWLNGGYFVFKRDIFNFMKPGEELVLEPFQRLIALRQLTTYKHAGFWACMDTFKEKQVLEDLFTRGAAPWEVWKHGKSSSNGAADRRAEVARTT
jgi:glucose-1-phosphate cytidylyltransferase